MLVSNFEAEETQKIYYTATTKVTPVSNSLGSAVIQNIWNSSTGEGVIVCLSDITSIGDSAFYRYHSLTSVTIPDSVTSMGRFTFLDCSALTSVTIGNSVTSIGAYAFSGCTSLTSITIPNSVTSIDESAFDRCSALTSITIPDNVTSIGYCVFHNCTSMQYLDFSQHITIPIFSSVLEFGNIPDTCKIVVPDSLYDEWIVAEYWTKYASNIVKKSNWDAQQVTE